MLEFDFRRIQVSFHDLVLLKIESIVYLFFFCLFFLVKTIENLRLNRVLGEGVQVNKYSFQLMPLPEM